MFFSEQELAPNQWVGGANPYSSRQFLSYVLAAKTRDPKARARASAWPPAERAAILADIERPYRAALEAVVAERQAGENPTD